MPNTAFALFRMGFSKYLSLSKASAAASAKTNKINPNREPRLQDKGSPQPILGKITHAIPKKITG